MLLNEIDTHLLGFVLRQLGVISAVILNTASESGIGITSLVKYSKKCIFDNFWNYVQDTKKF